MWALLCGMPSGVEGKTATLYLRVQSSETTDERAELLAPGSARLEQICAAALRQGSLARAFVLPASSETTPLRPYLVFHFRVAYVGHDVRERTASVAVDLVDGVAFSSPPLGDMQLEATADGFPTETPRLSVGDAHERAVEVLCDSIADEDATWYHEKFRWIEDELDRLYEYLQRAANEFKTEDELTALRDARLFELRGLNRPRVEVRVEAATVLYAPPYWPNPASMYSSRRRQ